MFKPGDTGGTSSSPVDLLFRPGMMIPYAGVAAPTGWLLADGSVVSQITYAALFAVCGTAFNIGGEPVGDFRLPNPISRSIMGAGITAGLTAVAIGEKKGEETHVLLTTELATHNHGVTDPGHNHTQNAHTHTVTDPKHNHTQNAHTHTQNAHTHTQNSHNHGGATGSHDHWYRGVTPAAGLTPNAGSGAIEGPQTTSTSGSTATIASDTATNQNTTATNQNTTATNIANTTGITNQNTTATNVANTTGVTTNNEGSSTGHNTIHPVLGMTYIIKY